MCGGACVGKYHRLGRGCSASELFHKRVRALVLSSFGLSESEYFHKQTRLGPKLLAAQQRLTIYFLLDSPPVRDMVESMSEGHGGVRVRETLTGERVFVGNGWKCEKNVVMDVFLQNSLRLD